MACAPRGPGAHGPTTGGALYAAPLPKGERTAPVDVLWVRKREDPDTGEDRVTAGLTRVRLRVAPNRHRVVAVGVAEQFPGGAGDTWRASVWLAARAASRALGRELPEYRFLAETKGFIDGPSAGALFTAGFLAAALGVPVRPEVTMTGTITPDGTVGRVGGLEHKLRAALRAGKKIIGYPAGKKVLKAANGTYVNLETLAAEQGARAVPVRNVHEAFRLLTGRALHSLRRVDPRSLGLAPSLRRQLLGWTATWHKELVRHRRRAGRQAQSVASRARLLDRL
ncbi:MAG: S16 family serine protease, partial [bacterium]